MLVMRTTENPAYPLGKLVSAKQSVGLYHLALAMHPFGLDHLGSIALSHGLFLGRRQLTILTPRSLFLTSRLCFPSHLLTWRLMCQEALSQMRTNTFLPTASSLWQHH